MSEDASIGAGAESQRNQIILSLRAGTEITNWSSVSSSFLCFTGLKKFNRKIVGEEIFENWYNFNPYY